MGWVCPYLGRREHAGSQHSHFYKGVSPFTKGLFIFSHLFSKHVPSAHSVPVYKGAMLIQVHKDETTTSSEMSQEQAHGGTLAGLHCTSKPTQIDPFSPPQYLQPGLVFTTPKPTVTTLLVSLPPWAPKSNPHSMFMKHKLEDAHPYPTPNSIL